MLLLNQNVYERRREHKMTSWKDRLALTAQRNRQEIVKAKLDRREMMRLGLLTAGGSLIAKAGLSSRAFGAGLTDKDATLIRQPPSPPAQPWKAPMPRLTVKTPVDRHAMLYGTPDGTTPIDGATKRIPHQYFSYNAATDTLGPGTAGSFIPQKFYELTAAKTNLTLHPDYAPTSVWRSTARFLVR
jgi:hypothetical protein